MRALISKGVSLMIFVSAACAFADTKLPKCVMYTFGNCQGSLKYPNGDIYTGEFNYGQPNGSGRRNYANGDLYTGSFYEGQKHGVGDYTWADGNRYIGQFIEGNLQGRGIYYFLANNKVNPDKYIGDFKKNAFNGDGVYTYGNGAVVAGKFKDGRKVDDLPAVAVTEAQTKTAPNSGVNQANKYEEKNVQNVTVTAIKSNISKGKELLALADVSRLTEEKSSLATQLDSQAELDRTLRLKLEIEAAAALIAKEKAQSIADENARLKSQIETQTELDRSLRLKLEAASADAVIAKEKAQSIADENARLKSKIETHTELDRNLQLKLEAESAVALIAKEKAQFISDENANLKRQIEIQAELDRKLRLKLEAEDAAAAIAHAKAQSIADENVRLKSQIEAELEMERSLRIKMEGVQARAKNNDSEEIIKNTLSSIDVPSLMTTFEKGKLFISGSLNSNSSSLFGRHYDVNNNLTLIELRQKDKPSDVPYSIMIGYKFDEKYGVEFGYLSHGNVKSEVDASFFKSESWLLGAYFEIPLYSGIGIKIKGGIQNTAATMGVIYTPLNSTSNSFNEYSGSGYKGYYGLGVTYSLNENYSIYLDYTNIKGYIYVPVSFLPEPQPINFTKDVIGLGLKYSF